MRIRFCVLVCHAPVLIALLAILAETLPAQQPADASLETLHPAEGLEVSLWASEPMVNNPTSMDIDSRGRVWIAEGLNYRMKQGQFENLKRVENADRIKILSDTDGDGKADSVVVFAENIFPVPLGLAVEEIWVRGKQTGTRVYVGNSPDLLVLEDLDGDDKAEHRYALLTGFRGIDSDHGLHGMTFGPDGKLYFTVGDARYGADKVQPREQTFDVTDRSGRRLSCSNFGTTLRVNRDGTQLEVLSSGHRNNYEAAVDSFGNVFGSDNDDDGNRGARMYWVMEGGQYGYQNPNSSRHWAEELPGMIPKLVGTGNGAPGGLTVYEGNLLPERYLNSVLQVDSATHHVNAHRLVRHGAGFRSDYEVLLKGNDAWFRPVDVAVAPDGSVLVCDWYDAGVGGNRFSDQNTGRIYRLKATAIQQQSKNVDGRDAIRALQSPNTATRLAARGMLVSAGEAARLELLELFRMGQPQDRARALHVLYDLPNTGTDDAIAALGDLDPRIRETALQLLARDATREFVVEPEQAFAADPPATQFLNQFQVLADDDDAGVRRALLMVLRNVSTNLVGETLVKLADSWDGQDRYYLEALRAAVIHRDSQFVQELFDHLAQHALEVGWNEQPVALPPYYPIGTNDAFLRPTDQLLPSNAASRVIGLAWVLRRPESLSALKRILENNRSPSVEQAATIALSGISDVAAGRLLMQRFLSAKIHVDGKRESLRQLGDGVSGPWKDLANDPLLTNVITAALKQPALQADAVQAIARGRIVAFGDELMSLAQDETSEQFVRAAAISSLGTLHFAPARMLTIELLDRARRKPSGGPIALAALAASQSLSGQDAANILMKALKDSEMPLDLRRRALQLATASTAGVDRVLVLRQEEAFPVDLENELVFLLQNHVDRRVRETAAKVWPSDDIEGNKKVHNVQSVLSLPGNASRGRQLFETNKDAACARCHRVTGEGSLVGPDLASIGLKYDDKELLYHIQFPIAAINFSFVAHTFALTDGRVLTGLVNERKDGSITIGIATGQMVSFPADDVEEEVPQVVSLMPEGLVAKLTPQQVSDLIEYLLTLRQGDAGLSQTHAR